MNLSKLLLPAACGALLFLVACGEDNPIEEIKCNPLPTLTTEEATDITAVSATLTGTIEAPACDDNATAKGFVYAVTETPTLIDSIAAISGEVISKEISNLKSNKKYYYRTYYTNETDTYYGEQKSFTTTIPQVGNEIAGGIVFYIADTPTDLDGDGDLDTGLVCATEDQSDSVKWNNGSYSTTGATSASVGSGATNTATIIASQGAGTYAASVASNYNGGGFDDWFLPSKDELNLMYTNLKTEGLGSFSSENYWSATEDSYSLAWRQNFIDGYQSNTGTHSPIKVRAVRAF